MRWTNVHNENYNNSGGLVQFNRDFTRSTLNSTSELEGNAFASFLLGAPSGGQVDVNPTPHYKWFFAAPWIQDDWRVSNKLTVNLGFRWDVNGSVTEENNMLNYAFDPTLVNPVSARVGQQVLGGIRFAGVDGAPDRPWKLDKNNYQFRVGTAYSINEKTVFRAGYGKYFLNPTGQGNNAGFSQTTSLISSNDGGRTPTYSLSNPWPSGIVQPPGSSLGALTFLGRGPNFSNPDFVVPNVHQFSAGIQRELPWRISLEMTYAGSRSYDIEVNINGLQRTVGRLPGPVRRHPGRQPQLLRSAAAESVLRGRRIRGHEALHEPDAVAFRAQPPVPGVHRHHPQPAQHRQADLRLGAVRREQALGEGGHHQRQLHVGAALDRGRRLRGRGLGPAERGAVLLAAQAPHHRLRRVGTALVPQRAQHRRISPRRLVDGADAGLPVRPAVGHARERRSGAGRQPRRDRAAQARRMGSSSTASSRASASVSETARIRSAVGLDGVRLHRALLPHPRGLPAPHRDDFRYDEFRRPSLWQVDVNFAKTTPITESHPAAGASRGVQPLQQPDVRRASVQSDARRRRTSAASTGTPPASRTSSGSSSWDSG